MELHTAQAIHKTFIDSILGPDSLCTSLWYPSFINNKYRVLRSCNGDHLNQRVPGGNNRTEGMASISGINQLGPQKLQYQVS